MAKVKFETFKKSEKGCKIYFTSYLREDFVEKSIVISTDENYTVISVYLASYKYGSVEWINGEGLTGCRLWETDEQAESAGYLTRRYTSRLSNGYAPDGQAENLIIPDILGSFEDQNIARTIRTILESSAAEIKIDPRNLV